MAIPHDVYITYSIFVLTSAMRMKVLPLSLQPEVPSPPSDDLSTSQSKARTLLLEAPKSTENTEGTEVVCFLKEPFEIPAVIAQPTFIRSCNYLPEPRPEGMTGPMTLTPEGLRYLSVTTDLFQTDVHAVMLSARTLEHRVRLQREELRRQVACAADLLGLIKQLKETRRNAMQQKVASVQAGLKALLAKEDRILNALMKKASPDLSENETKWFQELKRMRVEIKGLARYDSDTLSARTATVRFTLIAHVKFPG